MGKKPTQKKKAGLPPGTVVHTGQRRLENASITVFDYDKDALNRYQAASIEEVFSTKPLDVRWLNIDGLHDTELIEKIGDHYGIHPLVLEDICHTNQRPKIEEFDNYIYVVLKMLTYNDATGQVAIEQVSLVLGDGYVISFQEALGDVLEPLRQRIISAKGRIRKQAADYLLYAVIDSIIDNYFVVIEAIGEKIEAIQQQVAAEPTQENLRLIYEIKRQMVALRRAVWPLRELVNGLQKTESELVKTPTMPFIRDIYDHVIQIIDTTETLRETASGLLEIYLSTINNRMSSVMQVLTIIATLFIPLTFIAGIYGMNFEYMPELACKWSYPIGFWVIVVGVIGTMLAYFKKKKWF